MRVALVYLLVGLLVILVATVAFERLGVPTYVLSLLLVVILLGFPVALFLAWAFEITPYGIRKDSAGDIETITKIEKQTDDMPSIAVLPFEDLSENGDQVYFCESLAEEILDVLRKVPNLRVASRVAAFELRSEQERLKETNIALRVLLRQRDEDRTRIEETIYVNVDRLVLPYVEQLLQGRFSDRQRTLTEVIDANLRDIISPFLQNLSALTMLLTPQEIEVANMVRSGRTSKEIAEVLGISASGVDFHRKKLRQKLGLTNSSRNLRSYLLSLEKK